MYDRSRVADDRIELAGTVTAIRGRAPATWTIEIDGDAQTRCDDGSFELAVDGRSIEVTASSIAVEGDTEVQKGRWGDLCTRGGFAVGEKPAYARAKLSCARIDVGDHLSIAGGVLARDADGHPTHIQASTLAKGRYAADTVARADGRPPANGSPVVELARWGFIVALAIAAVAAAVFVPFPDGVRRALMPAIAVVVIVAMLPSGRRAIPNLYAMAEKTAPNASTVILVVRLAAVVGLFVGLILCVTRDPEDGADGAFLVATGFVAVGLVVWIAAQLQLTKIRRLFGRTWNGERDPGHRVVIRGTVHATSGGSKRVLDRDAQISIEDAAGFSAEGGDYREAGTYVGSTRFEIRCPHGPVSVDANEIIWGTSRQRDSDYEKHGTHTKLHEHQWVEDGAPVVAGGWIKDGALRSRGGKPAVLLAGLPDEDPLAIPRAVLAYWRRLGIALVVLAGLFAVIATNTWQPRGS